MKAGFPLAFLATSGATPNIKSGGTNNQDLLFTTGTGNPTRLQITSGGTVNIGANNSSQTTYKAQIETGTNKFISFTNAAHDDFSDEGSAIIFSRPSDGAKLLSGIFEHSNTSFGIATRSDLTFHAGGTSTYSASPERVRITSGGIVNIGTNLTNTTYGLLHLSTDTSTNNTELIRLQNSHTDGKMTVMGFNTDGLGYSQTRIYGGNDNTGGNGQAGDSGAGKFKVTITNPSGTHQEVIYAENDANGTVSKFVRLSTNGSERLRIDSNGQVLIGTSTSSAYGNRQLAVGDTTDSSSFIEIRTSATGVGHLLFARTAEGNSGNYHGYIAYTQSNSAMTFHTNAGTERVRITSGGQLYVNTSATDTMFGVKNSGTFELITCRDTSNSLKFYVHHSGATYNSGGSYGSISDVSLKENIVDANSQWDDIKNIKVRNFNFKESTGQETYTQIGVIAQEIETVSPKLVSTPKDEIKTVKYSILYMKAVKALQEAMIRIEALETKVSALEGS